VEKGGGASCGGGVGWRVGGGEDRGRLGGSQAGVRPGDGWDTGHFLGLLFDGGG